MSSTGDIDQYDKPLDELLNLSMIPRACQECQLSTTDSTQSESIDWVLNLKDKPPIWSLLNDINTSGYRRKLPMSMTKFYDIEIEGRLWSLWGSKWKHKMTQYYTKSFNKFHMAATVMALCTARVIRLNIWNSQLMDSIANNAKIYFKNSLENYHCITKNDFQLKNLNRECCLEGICFKICLKTVQQGNLYSIPSQCQPNLALALTKFFAKYQFGLLECCNRVLGIGSINDPSGGYFLYDAQSINEPLFPKGYFAPYILRTNHLQVLLYCLIVTLNVPITHIEFSLHQLLIDVSEPKIPKVKLESNQLLSLKCHSILPKEYWQVPSLISLKYQSSNISPFEEIRKCKQLLDVSKPIEKAKAKQKYRRKFHNITKEEVEEGVIKPLVDDDRTVEEGFKLEKDFVRMICSDTILPLIPTEKAGRMAKGFACNLIDAMIMGPEICSKFGQI